MTTPPQPPDSADYSVATAHELAADDLRVNQIRRQLDSLGQGMELGSADFDWDHATLGEYRNTAHGQMIAVPAVSDHQRPLERMWITAPYSAANQAVRGVVVHVYRRKSEQITDQFELHFADPSRRPFVGLDVDTTNERVRPIRHQRVDYTDLELPGVAGDYWGCMGSCLWDTWGNLPEVIRWFCGGACGSCLFSPNYASCGGCVVCLGGYAGGCTGWCLPEIPA